MNGNNINNDHIISIDHEMNENVSPRIVSSIEMIDDDLESALLNIKLNEIEQEKSLILEMNKVIRGLMTDIDLTMTKNDISEETRNELIKMLKDDIDMTKNMFQNEINIIRSDITNRKKILENRITKIQTTNWDDENINTVNMWLKEGNKQEFIYESVLEKIVHKSKRIKIILLIITAIQSLVTISNLGLDETKDYALILSIKILMTILATISYILTQIMSIEKFEDIIKEYTLYTDNIGNFLSVIFATADLKPELRQNGDDFILNNRETYADIYKNSPYMKQSYWLQGIEEYNKYIETIDVDAHNHRSRKRKIFDDYAKMNNNNININRNVRNISNTPNVRRNHVNPNDSNVHDTMNVNGKINARKKISLN
jgi:hypothetical protein